MMRLVAKTFKGLEKALDKEIKQLGVEDSNIVNRGVEFEGDLKTLYTANLKLRSALSIMVHLKSGKISSGDDIYNLANEVKWTELFKSRKTINIQVIGRSRHFNNSMYASLKVKDAIADQFREAFGERPNVEKRNPNIRITIHLNEDKVDLLLDSSGDPLFKRGYKVWQHKAPMNECLAAGLILLSDWDGKKTFLDPFSGSATIPIEAALIASNTAPNLNRESFCFKHWRGFNKSLLHNVKLELEAQVKPVEARIYAGEIDANNVRKARKNIREAGFEEVIKPIVSDFFNFPLPMKDGIIVSNPPYNERLKIKEPDFYKKMGTTLKKNFKNFEVNIFTSDLENIAKLKLNRLHQRSMVNGKLDCTYNTYLV